jgi:hypothetical protein
MQGAQLVADGIQNVGLASTPYIHIAIIDALANGDGIETISYPGSQLHMRVVVAAALRAA